METKGIVTYSEFIDYIGDLWISLVQNEQLLLDIERNFEKMLVKDNEMLYSQFSINRCIVDSKLRNIVMLLKEVRGNVLKLEDVTFNESET